jgi:protein arginine N-methyltransferase 2
VPLTHHPPLHIYCLSFAAASAAEAGAPWHAQDEQGHTAGEYASGGGHRGVVRQLLDWAVKAELILGAHHC